MVMGMNPGGAMPMGAAPNAGQDIDAILIPKIQALPMELKKTLLDIITKMENPSANAPVGPGLEGNLTAMGGGM